jgi:uncharacterized membrane protein
MTGFTLFDGAAIAFFLLSWTLYHLTMERGPRSGRSLTSLMNERRRRWFEQAMGRDNRIIDTQVMNGLQNGTAFFTSTSLIAVGGSAALLQATEQVMHLSSDIWFIAQTTRGMWEVKIIGLAGIFGYAFFKFGWSYRLFNYSAILLGALPPASERGTPEAVRALAECTAMNIAAGRHFNRGQRAFFFALAYLGWFLGPAFLVLFTAGALAVMWRRQHASDSRDALEAGEAR